MNNNKLHHLFSKDILTKWSDDRFGLLTIDQGSGPDN